MSLRRVFDTILIGAHVILDLGFEIVTLCFQGL
jgi:hypothetical protein